MSTAFFLLLAIVIIFCHPPFHTPVQLKNIFRPIVLFILTMMLIFVGALNSLTSNDKNKIDTTEIESKVNCCNFRLSK